MTSTEKKENSEKWAKETFSMIWGALNDKKNSEETATRMVNRVMTSQFWELEQTIHAKYADLVEAAERLIEFLKKDLTEEGLWVVNQFGLEAALKKVKGEI